MCEPWWGMGPVSEPLSRHLWGRHLRYASLAVLLRARRPMSVAELRGNLEGLGFDIIGHRPVKTLADALGHEAARGRVIRVDRGRYRIGTIPPRIHASVAWASRRSRTRAR